MKHTLSTSQDRTPAKVWLGAFAIGAVLLVLPFLLGATAGQGWIRILNFALLYVMLALGLNIVVGFAGLLDLGYIAFYAVGAYAWALLASPHFDLHLPFWMVLPIGVALAAAAGIALGFPVLKLRGDYLAIVTLGFGEIIRIFMNNLDAPVNITNGPRASIGWIPSKSVNGRWAALRRFWAFASPAQKSTTTCCWRWSSSSSLSAFACKTRAWAAPGKPCARTKWPPRPWASTPAASS